MPSMSCFLKLNLDLMSTLVPVQADIGFIPPGRRSPGFGGHSNARRSLQRRVPRTFVVPPRHWDPTESPISDVPNGRHLRPSWFCDGNAQIAVCALPPFILPLTGSRQIYTSTKTPPPDLNPKLRLLPKLRTCSTLIVAPPLFVVVRPSGIRIESRQTLAERARNRRAPPNRE